MNYIFSCLNYFRLYTGILVIYFSNYFIRTSKFWFILFCSSYRSLANIRTLRITDFIGYRMAAVIINNRLSDYNFDSWILVLPRRRFNGTWFVDYVTFVNVRFFSENVRFPFMNTQFLVFLRIIILYVYCVNWCIKLNNYIVILFFF